MNAKMVKWFDCCASEPDLGVQLQEGMSNFFYFYFVFSFFQIGHREGDVINCFFSFEVAHFSKISNHIYKNTSLSQYCVMH